MADDTIFYIAVECKNPVEPFATYCGKGTGIITLTGFTTNIRDTNTALCDCRINEIWRIQTIHGAKHAHYSVRAPDSQPHKDIEHFTQSKLAKSWTDTLALSYADESLILIQTRQPKVINTFLETIHKTIKMPFERRLNMSEFYSNSDYDNMSPGEIMLL